jgi:hypothetical protein
MAALHECPLCNILNYTHIPSHSNSTVTCFVSAGLTDTILMKLHCSIRVPCHGNIKFNNSIVGNLKLYICPITLFQYILLWNCVYSLAFTAPISLPYQSQSQSHVATDGQPVSQSWCRAPSGAHDQKLITV